MAITVINFRITLHHFIQGHHLYQIHLFSAVIVSLVSTICRNTRVVFHRWCLLTLPSLTLLSPLPWLPHPSSAIGREVAMHPRQLFRDLKKYSTDCFPSPPASYVSPLPSFPFPPSLLTSLVRFGMDDNTYATIDWQIFFCTCTLLFSSFFYIYPLLIFVPTLGPGLHLDFGSIVLSYTWSCSYALEAHRVHSQIYFADKNMEISPNIVCIFCYNIYSKYLEYFDFQQETGILKYFHE